MTRDKQWQKHKLYGGYCDCSAKSRRGEELGAIKRQYIYLHLTGSPYGREITRVAHILRALLALCDKN
jgi:hypothetical protein